MFISIGSDCSTRHHIQTYNGVQSQQTLFFDWLLVDMESVIQLFTHYADFDTYFSQQNFVSRGLSKFNSHMVFTPVSRCEFLHDLRMNYTQIQFDEFIDKYRRRFARILDYIHSTEKLYFVFKGAITDIQRDKFIHIIQTINPQCNFTLVHIIKSTAPVETIIEPNFICIDASQFKKDTAVPADWMEKNYDWVACFDTIVSLTR